MNEDRCKEFFRHLRPTWFDKVTIRVLPLRCGGVSFLIRPTLVGYDFWVNICPKDTAFSASQAIHSLRSASKSGVTPWGQVPFSTEPVLDNICNSILSMSNDIPGSDSLRKQITYILRKNVAVLQQKNTLISQGAHYENC